MDPGEGSQAVSGRRHGVRCGCAGTILRDRWRGRLEVVHVDWYSGAGPE